MAPMNAMSAGVKNTGPSLHTGEEGEHREDTQDHDEGNIVDALADLLVGHGGHSGWPGLLPQYSHYMPS